MCLARRNIRDLDPKTRCIWAIGNLCLFTGTSQTLFAGNFRHLNPNLFDALRGFLIAIAIVFMLWSARRIRSFNSRP
jgi:hypothetical protein